MSRSCSVSTPTAPRCSRSISMRWAVRPSSPRWISPGRSAGSTSTALRRAASVAPSWSTVLLDRAATAVSLEMLGSAARVLDLSVEYAKDRVQFGRPIGSFQAVKHRCADMLVDVEGMRSSAYWAAWCLAADDPDVSIAASTAKTWGSDASKRVMASGLQVHGGIGFTWEHDLHLFLKRAQLDQWSFGDAVFHRERLAVLVARQGRSRRERRLISHQPRWRARRGVPRNADRIWSARSIDVHSQARSETRLRRLRRARSRPSRRRPARARSQSLRCGCCRDAAAAASASRTKSVPTPCLIQSGSTKRSSSSVTSSTSSVVANPTSSPSRTATRVRDSRSARSGQTSASGWARRLARSPSFESEDLRYSARSASISLGTASLTLEFILCSQRDHRYRALLSGGVPGDVGRATVWVLRWGRSTRGHSAFGQCVDAHEDAPKAGAAWIVELDEPAESGTEVEVLAARQALQHCALDPIAKSRSTSSRTTRRPTPDP